MYLRARSLNALYPAPPRHQSASLLRHLPSQHARQDAPEREQAGLCANPDAPRVHCRRRVCFVGHLHRDCDGLSTPPTAESARSQVLAVKSALLSSKTTVSTVQDEIRGAVAHGTSRISGTCGRQTRNAAVTVPFEECVRHGTRQTVYKHLRIYNDAVAADISLSGDTKWADVIKQVEALKTAVTESTALPKTIEVIDNEDEEELGFDVKNLKLEIYRRSGGILETFSPPDSYMDVIVLDQYAPGKIMRVHMAQYMANGNLKTIALKKIFLPGQWFDLWHNKTVATWVEGARLAECGILWQAFASRVRAVDIDLIGVEVLETFSFCQDDNIYFAQSWECGSKFFVNTWGSDLPIDAPNQVAVVEILTTFSHFTYQHQNHRSVFVDFEGFITQEGYRVFDSRTHSLVAMLRHSHLQQSMQGLGTELDSPRLSYLQKLTV
ncbi:hypothetical protein C8J57DRAFT_1479200 [Mycena rebaudengoi]|nr:hypothetical protein C8J57DRAFT_1479200 [Mycena rebaudengoi]